MTHMAMLALLSLIPAAWVAAQEPAITLFIKGSPQYGTATPAPVRTALLAVTPKWEGLVGSTMRGEQLAIGEVAVVLSSRAIDCAAAFTTPATAPDSAYHVVAGKILAYPQSGDWTATPAGKFLAGVDPEGAIESFSIAVYSGKKNVVAKDRVGAAAGRMSLRRDGDRWSVDLAFTDSKASVAASIPLTTCPIVERTTAVLKAKREDQAKAPDAPVLGLSRVLDAAFNYGKR